MNPDVLFCLNTIDGFCSDCDVGQGSSACQHCSYEAMRASLDAIQNQLNNVEIGSPEGCGFCRDKRGKVKSQFFLDNANNMRESSYCGQCGAKL